MSAENIPCPKCGGSTEWNQIRRNSKILRQLHCTVCGWQTIQEEITYSVDVTFKTYIIYWGVGALSWTIIGFILLLLSIQTPLFAIQSGMVPFLSVLFRFVCIGVVVGHLLKNSLGIGQTNQSIFWIVQVPILIFSMGGAALGLSFGFASVIGISNDAILRSVFIRVIAGLIIGFLAVRPTIMTARKVRMMFGLR